jgi:hypothetical protein
MAGMHHALIIASRVVAGIVGGFAFYCVTFMYENEQGPTHHGLALGKWKAKAVSTDDTSHEATTTPNLKGWGLR